MSSSYFLNQQPIVSQTQDLYIANWDNTQEPVKGFSNINSVFRTIAVRQRGEAASALFDNNFINYTEGYVLCVNTPAVLSALVGATNGAGSLLASLVFTVVRIPADFIGKESSLSSKYEYGEKLKVFFSFEINSLVQQNPFGVSLGGSYVSSIAQGTPRQSLVARDANVKGRAVKGASTGGGGGIGVWS